MSMDQDARIEAPLLKAYLRKAKSYSSFGLQIPVAVTWLTFAALVAIAPGGALLWIILALMSRKFIPSRRKPLTDAERTEEMTYKVIRRLKYKSQETSNVTKYLPREVAVALEFAVAKYESEVVRAQVETPSAALRQGEFLEESLHACLRAAAPVVRDEHQGKREWLALQENRQLIGTVVDSIQRQTERMSLGETPDLERLAALRELEGEDWTVVQNYGR